MWTKVKQFLLRNELLILILCLVTFLRIPSLMEPYWYGDEGIYLTLGNGVRHGLQLYRDIHDNKPPGIYLIAAVAGSEFGFKFILLVWNLVTLCVFWWIAHTLLDTKKRPKSFFLFGVEWYIPQYSTLAALFIGLGQFLVEGNIANGEIFMLLPTLVGMALLIPVWRGKQKQTIFRSLASGFFFSLAFLIKVPALFDAVAAGFFFFVLAKTYGDLGKKVWWQRPLLSLWKASTSVATWAFAAAFILPILMSVAYYAKVGALQPYLNSALLQNVGYLSSWATGTHQASNVGQSGLKNRALVLVATTLLFFTGSALFTSEALLLLVWFAFALFGALLSERPYPHYLIQILAPLSLLLFLSLKMIGQWWRSLHHHRHTARIQHLISLITMIVSIGVLVISLVTIHFWTYFSINYYQNYWNFMTKKITKDQYLTSFDPILPEMYRIGAMIVQNTTPNDRIFIWGDEPTLYALTRRLPPGRYTAAYHIKDFNGYDETLTALNKNKPKYVVIDKRAGEFPGLDTFLENQYQVWYSAQVFVLYRYTGVLTISPSETTQPTAHPTTQQKPKATPRPHS
ncbi:hypothetical protein C5B42_05840 [Candidatus Cerribacteria bacterium 'Amazon FNV 2010 28 9']|uniref:Glycosyltransferase RgtA/B/C/D-like domain-containing protein n=1 Tax=Candidatus Cerribacteria bacterium 'Amazon FNV 2010 28 9' TaxID=2081795 RepID=A0A317JLQ1_9BACT|nr:MAG: hypothetical protein C5B42_05840 [Candidatus Cerribacteria bacterium 'Amazon FNV 2010 28 9']